MKKLIALFCLFVLFGCHEENRVEVIPNYDEIYVPLSKIDSSPQLILSDEETLSKKINSLVKKSGEKVSLDYQLYINEEGNVDKIKEILNSNKIYADIIVKEMKGWKFKPGIKDGKLVKSQYRWKFNLNNSSTDSDIINSEVYHVAVEEMPELIGGIKAIQQKITYPEIAKRAGIEGKVYVLAFIDEYGSVVKTQIIRGLGAGLDEAAIKAVKETKFIPGRQRGVPVKVQVSIPIVFKLE